MKRNLIKIIQTFFFGLLILTSCEREPITQIRSIAYSNLNDFSTTDIYSNVLRVEFDQDDGDISLLLSITDQDGYPLNSFTIGNIAVYTSTGTDSVKVKVEEIVELGEEDDKDPIAAAMTMDYSSSMSSTDISNMEEAVKTFVRLKEDDDLIEIIKFASSVQTVESFTTDTTSLIEAIEYSASVGSSTAFYSSCEEGINSIKDISNVIPSIISLTDGGDNNSTITLNGLITLAQEYQIPVYTIGYGSGVSATNLSELALQTGGRFYQSPNSLEILDLYQLISEQLRQLYLVSWKNQYSSGTQLVISVTVTYTAGNGTFTHNVKKSIEIE